MAATKTELIRIDSEVLQDLRQYCLSKHGKVYGMIVEEATAAIKEHIEGDTMYVAKSMRFEHVRR